MCVTIIILGELSGKVPPIGNSGKKNGKSQEN
jgi:hypothetical protein